MTQPSDPDISGWYLKDNESQPQRVRVAIEGRSLSLRTLIGAEVARWSLDQLENVSIPIIGRDWVIRDRRVEVALLRLENDQDYAGIQRLASDLALVGTRTVKQVLFAGNHTGWPVIVLVILVSAIAALWQLFQRTRDSAEAWQPNQARRVMAMAARDGPALQHICMKLNYLTA